MNWPTAEQQELLENLIAGRTDRIAAWCARQALPLDRSTEALLPMAHLAIGGTVPWLAAHYTRQRAKNERAIEAGLDAADLLRTAGIPAVLVKGVPLCLFYHRDVAARPMADADLVVPARELLRADELLRAAGWPRKGKEPPRSALPYLPALDYQHPLASLDVQRYPFHVRSSEAAVHRFWAHCEEREVRGRRVLVPDATYMLIVTCWHGRKPESSLARWPLDADAILRSPIDWDELIAAVELAEIVAPVRDALAYLARALALPIPPEVTASLARRVPTRADRQRYKRLASGHEGSGAIGVVAARWDELAAVAGMGGVLRFPAYFVAANSYYWKGDLTLARVWSRLVRR